MRRVLLTSLGLAMTLGIVGTAEAQRRRGLADVTPESSRHGFWIMPGLGFGMESYKFASDPFSESEDKPTFILRLGGTPNGNFRIGGEVTVWWNEYQDVATGENLTETLSSLMLVGQYYPMRDAGLYLKAGAGLGRSAVDVSGGLGTGESGFAYNLGAGYDIPIGRKVFLSPTVDFYRHRFTKRDEPTLHERLVLLGIGVTIQPGR